MKHVEKPATLISGQPSLHPSYARMLCISLRNMGVDVEAALRVAGTLSWNELSISDAMLDQSTINRLVAAAMRATSRPWLGLDVGRTMPTSAHGSLGSAVAASCNVAQVIDVLARFGHTRYGSVGFELRQETNGAVLSMHELTDLGESRTFMVCAVFAVLIRMMEAVVGHRFDRIAVDFPFPQPSWCAEIQGVSNGPLRFDQSQLAFHFDQDTLLIPCVTADRQAYEAAYLQCQQILHQATLRPLKNRVFEYIEQREGAYPSLSEVAQHCLCSERTLIRRLKSEGSSYRALLDGARFRKAQWYLAHSTLTIEEIASQLGYADPSNFGRTFKRWSGALPSASRLAAGIA
jgi:AraC-like DNA-binding protein